jgi:hypothetical protein
VIIAGHIPPGQNQFDDIPLWHPAYVAQFLALVTRPEVRLPLPLGTGAHPVLVQYARIISAQLFAHFHRDVFRVMFADPVGASGALFGAPYRNRMPDGYRPHSSDRSGRICAAGARCHSAVRQQPGIP